MTLDFLLFWFKISSFLVFLWFTFLNQLLNFSLLSLNMLLYCCCDKILGFKLPFKCLNLCFHFWLSLFKETIFTWLSTFNKTLHVLYVKFCLNLSFIHFLLQFWYLQVIIMLLFGDVVLGFLFIFSNFLNLKVKLFFLSSKKFEFLLFQKFFCNIIGEIFIFQVCQLF